MSTPLAEPVHDGSGKPSSVEQQVPARWHLDPYLVWAQRTGYRYLVHGRSSRARLAGRLRQNHSLDQARESVRAVGADFDARAILDTPFFTATLSPLSDEACDALLHCASFVLAEPGMRALDLPEPSNASASAAAGAASPTTQPTAPLEHAVVIGVIDGRCGFANQAFCSGSESRLDRFWDQGDAPPIDPAEQTVWWSVPTSPHYGRVLDRSALNAIARRTSVATNTLQRVEIEKAVYRNLGHRPPQDADWSHGTHVLDTVLDEFTGDRMRPGVIYVQLPDAALRDTSARWTAAYVLDAVDYIVRHLKDGARAVINLSLGAFAGPHDGSSLLEQAIDSIADQSNGRITFVVAAGNTGRVTDDGTRDAKRCHASFTLEADESRVLAWDIDRADSTESFLELWSPRVEGAAGLSVALAHGQNPGLTSGEVGPDTVRDISRNGSIVAMVNNAGGSTTVPNGQGRLVLVALGHSRAAQSACAATGRWEVTITNPGKQPVSVDAWIERRDVPGELLGYRPQYGFAEDTLHGIVKTGSLGSLANGQRSIVVGAVKFDEEKCSYGIADYSSRGLGTNARPQVYALGQRTSRGFLSGTDKSLAGTSIAAAQVTAAVASALADEAASTEWIAVDALDALARKRWEAWSVPAGSACESVTRADELRDRLIILPKRRP
jgi:Subtilase family